MSYELPSNYSSLSIENNSSSIPETEWKRNHPLLKAQETGVGFIVYHTHFLEDDKISEAINTKKSIELDILGIDPVTDDIYPTVVLGHHPWMYLASGKPIPDYTLHRDPENIIDEVADKDVLVKFDIKSPSAIPWVADQAMRIRQDRRMLHAFVTDLHASSFSDVVKNPYEGESPHAVTEYVPLDVLKLLKEYLNGIPIQASCRGLSLSDISFRGGETFPLIDRICERIQGIAEVVNLNLRNGQKIPSEIIEYMWKKYQIMVELNIDADENAHQGIPFLGRSDDMARCSVIE